MTRRKFATPPSRSPAVAILALLATLLGCTGGEPDAADERLRSLEAERTALLREFGTIQSRIRRTQAAALGEPGTAAARDAFYEELRTFAAREGGESVALLDRALRVGADLTRLSTPVIVTSENRPEDPSEAVASPEERRAVARELAETERALRPFVGRAMRDPGVRASFEALQDSLVATMLRRDPAAAASLQRMEEVADSIGRVERAIAQRRTGS